MKRLKREKRSQERVFSFMLSTLFFREPDNWQISAVKNSRELTAIKSRADQNQVKAT
jgi:hypothetical protein